MCSRRVAPRSARPVALTITLTAVLLGMCADASAHGTSKGLGTFVSGVVHPLLEPAHLIALLALGLVLGQRGLHAAGPAVPAFVAGLVPGLVAAGLGWHPDTDVALLGLATLAGISVAASIPAPKLLLVPGCALVGACIGLGSSPDLPAGGALVATLCGTFFGAVLWLVNGAALVHQAARPWLRILIRVAGSWVTASSVLVLALWMAGRHPATAVARTPPADAAPISLDPRR